MISLSFHPSRPAARMASRSSRPMPCRISSPRACRDIDRYRSPNANSGTARLDQIRSTLWAALANTAGSQRIKNAAPDLASRLRADEFDYVVSVDAPSQSTYSFDIDHVYPASKSTPGSVIHGMRAIHWAAKKIDSMQAGTKLPELPYGISVDLFLKMQGRLA